MSRRPMTYDEAIREVYGTDADRERERYRPARHPWTGSRPTCRKCGAPIARTRDGWATCLHPSTDVSPTVERRP